jgi:radical SAM protein with 4Fe4S-binding SPASM domain
LILEEVLLTNGVEVTDEMLKFIDSVGMRMMISLDGDRIAHNQTRSLPNGDGTHSSVVNTIYRSVAFGVRPSISITITTMNLDGLAGAVELALKNDLPFNLNFYRECQKEDQRESRSPPPINRPTSEQIVEALQQVLSVIARYPLYELPLSNILDRTRLDPPHRSTCSAGQDYLVVGVEGEIAGCQMLLVEPWTTLDVRDPLAIIRTRGKQIFSSSYRSSECNSCIWFTACNGGCPLLRDSSFQREYCTVYRQILPSLVQLEAKRLLAVSRRLDETAQE